MKWVSRTFLCIILFTGLLALAKDLINPYWLPKRYRSFVRSPQFSSGVCISNKRWGVRNKKVVGFKGTADGRDYLLVDEDRYEHSQYVSKIEVDKYSKTVACR